MTLGFASIFCLAAALENIEELSLDDLLDPTLATATKTELKQSDTPGIVTVLTREDIEASGALYLMDLLQLVPGFQFGTDVLGVVGVGFRGLWGHEGKVLVMIDGLEMNDTLYGSVPFGNHFPLALIERVEIIRGPGSAVHGGFAGIAVINLITKSAKSLKGASAQLAYGQWKRAPARGSVSLSAGNAIGDLELSFNGSFGAGRRSDGFYTDSDGVTNDLRDSSKMQSVLFTVAAKYKGLQLRVLYDDHQGDNQTGYGLVESEVITQRFGTWLAEAAYAWKPRDNLTITPRLVWKHQQPWQVTGALLNFDKTTMRLRAGVSADWRIIDGLSALIGLEGYWDHGRLTHPDTAPEAQYFNGATSVSYGNGIGYLQLVWLNKWVNITGGVRAEVHSAFGPSFVPRIALTKAIDRVNLKLLYSQAFRQPTIENLNVNPDILPERTNVVEAEVAVRITAEQRISINGFFGRIDRAIVYGVVPGSDDETYNNAGHTGSSGVELEYQIKDSWGQLRLGYSFYTSAGQNSVDAYVNDGATLRGFAAHHVAFMGSFNLYKGLIFADTSGTFLSRRDPLPETLIVNAGLRLKDLIFPGLELSAGVANLADQRYTILQPYPGGHEPLPLGGRELYVRARIVANLL